MLLVLLWLDRFDLDGKQIANRRLRSLVENNRMPLRKVVKVDYAGEAVCKDKKKNILSIHLQGPDDPPQMEFKIETEADAQKAASYLASCFVLRLLAYEHHAAPPTNVILAAPALIRTLDIRYCDFINEEEDSLSEALKGSTFRRLSLDYSHSPAWQIYDNLLESLRIRGCNEIDVSPGAEEFHATEQGILRYCFTLDDGLALPKTRILVLNCANVTPAFFTKLVDIDFESWINHQDWDVTVRYGQKDHDKFFYD
ncbi:hypothetical protein AAVH_24276 [Aphelenchoides avenae]|nr:hypothetical protein AAVH_24276 [Aphelenchus avenae]